jgi:hypothetical protein
MAALRSTVVLLKVLFMPLILRFLSIVYLACSVSSLTVFTSRTKDTYVKPFRSFFIGIQDRSRCDRSDRKQHLLFSVGNNGADRKTSKKKVDEGSVRNTKKTAVKQGVKQGVKEGVKEGMILVDNLQVKKIR